MARVSLLAAFLKTVGESPLSIFNDPECEILKSASAPHLNSELSAFDSTLPVVINPPEPDVTLPVTSIPVEVVSNFFRVVVVEFYEIVCSSSK